MNFIIYFDVIMLILQSTQCLYMKKLIYRLVIIAVLSVASIYIFIPATITVSTVRYVKAYHNAVLKFQTDNKLINGWFQSVSNKTKDGYQYKGFTYHVEKTVSNITGFSVKSDKIDVKGNLLSFNIYLDSCAIQCVTEIEAGLNPINRISRYREAVQLKESMAGLMDQLKIFLDNSSGIYGINVKETQLKDSVLITKKILSPKYPSVEEIYKQVKLLSDYAASKNATIQNSPMLFVNKIDDIHYQSMIGIPINKVIEQTNDMRIKRMPYKGNIFVTEIKGGPSVIQKSFEQLNTYLLDSKRVSPAIPFEMMITDRSKETDTTKWITRWYYPIM